MLGNEDIFKAISKYIREIKNKKNILLNITYYMASGSLLPSITFFILSLFEGINPRVILVLLTSILPMLILTLFVYLTNRVKKYKLNKLLCIILILWSLYGTALVLWLMVLGIISLFLV